ncbi:MAG: pyrimidine dimer DNA glycosylase/endonuclease V [Pseudomonadota bacterium]
MRLWTLHPKYLDRAGLVALWREGLLAQQVLRGRTRGYRHHPQLRRFREAEQPLEAIAAYLRGVAAEATARGYRFDLTKIAATGDCPSLPCTDGQLAYERRHLCAKLETRDPGCRRRLEAEQPLQAHPLFVVQPGPVACWEADHERD